MMAATKASEKCGKTYVGSFFFFSPQIQILHVQRAAGLL